ncbi:hypothetical protein FisN_25Hu064 [Fistulifera solaris]|jgi:hypothetical protein|uniref:Uncharacterized protein n=1 Tax=Fistulifera solaris TaxID=1519565 RepID=A0A1Z5JWB3_FISSO|nr:hypothetical protein FisN_25Hu064 [Fistulifera solaris]|eukprot:GAX18088.1 hypothetical protein FisN_25Hu064 [Fistulifera solaris]
MKFNSHKDKPLKDNKSPVSILIHENKHIPDKHTSDASGLGRCVFMEPTVFVTPALSSQRLQATKRPGLVSVDDLVKDLSKLLISTKDHDESKESDNGKVSPSKDKNGHVSQSKTASPRVIRLLNETPEAFDADLGRCVQSMIDDKTFQVTQVTRSLRLKA